MKAHSRRGPRGSLRGRHSLVQSGPADRDEKLIIYCDRAAAALSAFPPRDALFVLDLMREHVHTPLPPPTIHLAGESSYLLVVQDIKNSRRFPGSLTTSALISI